MMTQVFLVCHHQVEPAAQDHAALFGAFGLRQTF
jgi:hypothetical protein